jgi:ADP-ribose pyrophosphatase YjhB (NUDIX family)
MGFENILDDSERTEVVRIIAERLSAETAAGGYVVLDTNCLNSATRARILRAAGGDSLVYLVHCTASDSDREQRLVQKVNVQVGVHDLFDAKKQTKWVAAHLEDPMPGELARLSGAIHYDSSGATATALQVDLEKEESIGVMAALQRICARYRGEAAHAGSYLTRLRAVLGTQKLILPSVRVVLLTPDRSRVLLVRRSSDDVWALLGGGQELGESVHDAMVREVREESGYDVQSASLVAVHSAPRFDQRTPYGDLHQSLTFVFSTIHWSGELVAETDETTNARFFGVGALPAGMPQRHVESIRDAIEFNGSVRLK